MATFVGIDIASKKFDYRIISEQDDRLSKGCCAMNREGFTSLLADPHITGESVFTMESTGPYHIPLKDFLLSRKCNVFCINPIKIKQYIGSESLRRTKTDSADALHIAKYACTHYDALTEERCRMDEEEKIIARRRQNVAEDIARAKTQLKADLSVAWPELLNLDVFTDSLLRFLSWYGCADEVLAASEDDLISALKGERGRTVNLSVQTIRNLAVGSIGIGLRSDLVKDSATKILFLQDRDKRLTHSLVQREKHTHEREIAILTSIPGVGKTTAAHFMAEIESIDRFGSYQKLIAFIGTDPGIYQSGSYSAAGHITKHGNSNLRKYCFLMAQKTIRYSPFFKAYYDKKRAEGFPYRKAMVAVMNKLIRIIYALLKKGVFYEEKG